MNAFYSTTLKSQLNNVHFPIKNHSITHKDLGKMHASVFAYSGLVKNSQHIQNVSFFSVYGGKLTRLVILNTSASRKIAIDHRNRVTTVALKSV